MTNPFSPFAGCVSAIAACTFSFAALAQTAPNTPNDRVFKTEHYTVRAVTLIKGLYHPWGLAFLPDGRMIVTERRGTMRIVDGGKLVDQPIGGIPKATEHGQGGLLDVALHPKYAENGWIYWTYNAGTPGEYGTELARGKLGGTRESPLMTNWDRSISCMPNWAAFAMSPERLVWAF